jgi:hypothetical protein
LVGDFIVRFQVVEVDMSVLCPSCVLENVGGIINQQKRDNQSQILLQCTSSRVHVKEIATKKEQETHSTSTSGY